MIFSRVYFIFFTYMSFMLLHPLPLLFPFFFFLNDPPPPEISPLPLHDALPIPPQNRLPQCSVQGQLGYSRRLLFRSLFPLLPDRPAFPRGHYPGCCTGKHRFHPPPVPCPNGSRSEEHTSELQSHLNLLFRLLLL